MVQAQADRGHPDMTIAGVISDHAFRAKKDGWYACECGLWVRRLADGTYELDGGRCMVRPGEPARWACPVLRNNG